MLRPRIKEFETQKRNFKRKFKGADTVIKNTVSDFKSRAPGWVSKEVREVYNIKLSSIKEALKIEDNPEEKIKIAGKNISNAALVYEGRLLTPLNFSMTPKKPKKNNAPTDIYMTVFKGVKKKLPNKVFLAPTGGEGDKYIPFIRLGQGRLPIFSFKTLSIPQMITNPIVSKGISKTIDENLAKRMEHHTNRQLK